MAGTSYNETKIKAKIEEIIQKNITEQNEESKFFVNRAVFDKCQQRIQQCLKKMSLSNFLLVHCDDLTMNELTCLTQTHDSLQALLHLRSMGGRDLGHHLIYMALSVDDQVDVKEAGQLLKDTDYIGYSYSHMILTQLAIQMKCVPPQYLLPEEREVEEVVENTRETVVMQPQEDNPECHDVEPVEDEHNDEGNGCIHERPQSQASSSHNSISNQQLLHPFHFSPEDSPAMFAAAGIQEKRDKMVFILGGRHSDEISQQEILMRSSTTIMFGRGRVPQCNQVMPSPQHPTYTGQITSTEVTPLSVPIPHESNEETSSACSGDSFSQPLSSTPYSRQTSTQIPDSLSAPNVSNVVVTPRRCTFPMISSTNINDTGLFNRDIHSRSLNLTPSLLGSCPIMKPLETEPDGMPFNKEQNTENDYYDEKNT